MDRPRAGQICCRGNTCFLSTKTTSCSMEENSIIHGLMFSCLLLLFVFVVVTFLSHESFLVKNDRSAVDIRNRPRIPVPDEVNKKQLKQKKNIFSWSQFISTKDDAGDWEHEENVVIVANAQDPYSVAGSGSSGSSGPGGPRWKNSWLTFFHLFDPLQSPSPVFTIFILPICHQTSGPARNLKPRSKFEMLQKIWKMQFCNLILNIRTCQTKAGLMVHFFKTTYD